MIKGRAVPSIPAKETHYNGYRFRSRLEARWAVFFDTLNIAYEYEKETFDLSYLLAEDYGWTDGGAPGEERQEIYDKWRRIFNKGTVCYLPDFWLPQVHMWAEVKPEQPSLYENAKMQMLVVASGYTCLRLIGVPEDRPYDAWEDGGNELYLIDYCLTNYHDYVVDEGRFYCSPGGEWDSHFEDTAHACIAARSARFEWGEHGR